MSCPAHASYSYSSTTDASYHRAIESGANAIAEGFLFAVAAGLILGESWRTSRNQAKRRDAVDDTMEDLTKRVEVLTENVKELRSQYEEQWEIEKSR